MSHDRRPHSSRPGPAVVVPPSFAATAGLSRRGFLKSVALAGAAVGSPGLLAACGGDEGGGGGGNTVTFGMNEAGQIAAAERLREMAKSFESESGLTVERNEVSHNTFQENINTYLQGNPDDVFTWFAGFRMDQFAQQGLIGDISDVWPIDGMDESFKQASTGSDGNQYFVPAAYYTWALFYKPSLWEENGYEVPQTSDEMVALAKRMERDGVIPFAFADKDGWPAMGTFDILDMRLNGFDYHMALMRGEEAWDSPEVKQVFTTWRDLLPYHQPDALGRTWQEAATSLQNGRTGMYLLGTFVIDAMPNIGDDIGMFIFPEFDPAIGAKALDAPIDGYCMAADPDNEEGAKQLLSYLGSAEAANVANGTEVPFIPANSQADTSLLTPIQQKTIEVANEADNLAQFLDRDTRADFAATVMIPSLQTFLQSPDDIDGLTNSIQQQKVSIFGS